MNGAWNAVHSNSNSHSLCSRYSHNQNDGKNRNLLAIWGFAFILVAFYASLCVHTLIVCTMYRILAATKNTTVRTIKLPNSHICVIAVRCVFRFILFSFFSFFTCFFFFIRLFFSLRFFHSDFNFCH